MTTTELRPQDNPAGEKNEIAVFIDGAHCGYGKTYRDAARLRDEILAARAEAAELAQQERAAGVIEARTPAPKRRRKPSPCTCGLCAPSTEANGVYRCRAGQEWVAFHAGLYIASGPNFLQINDKLNDYRRTLLKRPLPDATPEEVESVLAADQ